MVSLGLSWWGAVQQDRQTDRQAVCWCSNREPTSNHGGKHGGTQAGMVLKRERRALIWVHGHRK